MPTYIYPLITELVCVLFVGFLVRQYLERRKPYQLIWSIALGLAVVGTLAYLICLAQAPLGQGVLAFRIYYIAGALLMPAWLGLGSIYISGKRRLARWSLLGLLLLSAIGTALVLTAPLNLAKLAALNGGPGTGILQPGAWLLITITLNSLGVIAVVGVAAYSSWQRIRKQAAGRFVVANALIALGDLVLGGAGYIARLGFGGGFWLTMTIGWLIIFVGFLLTLAPRSRPLSPQPSALTGTANRA